MKTDRTEATMQYEAARPKGNRAPGDEPIAQPMHASRQGEVRRNPSTDQKRQRREMSRQRKIAEVGTKIATVRDANAWNLNPGDSIKMPNGKTMKVHRVRQHETSPHHVYVDTDGGTTLSKRMDTFQVVHHNSQQQSLPGYGIPGGNSNVLPFDPQNNSANNENDSKGKGNAAGKDTQCPSCRGKGTLARQGDHYTCNKCGYRESFGGAGGHSFTDSPRQVQTSLYSTINTPGMSAIARRAHAFAQEESS